MPAYESHALSLYCDAIAEHQDYRTSKFPEVIYDSQQRVCRERAKQRGWKFTGDGRLLCPQCVAKRIKLPKIIRS